MSNSYANSSQPSTSTSVLGKRKYETMPVHASAELALESAKDAREDSSPIRSRVRSSTNNSTEIAAEDLLKTPTNKPEPTPALN
jgi:hypothetical protein